MKNMLSILCVCVASTCFAADSDSTAIDIKNNILFFKDPRVDVLQKMYMRKAVDPNAKVIRVQVFQAIARDKVFEAKAQFSARYPGIQTFVTYASPNFRLRVGEFSSQQEAFKFMQQVKPHFPMSFVIEEKGSKNDDKPKSKSGN